MKLRQPSRGTNAAIFLPFLISCARTHLRIAELGCFASMPLQTQQHIVSSLVCSHMQSSSDSGNQRRLCKKGNNAHFLKNDPLAMRRATKRIALELSAKVCLLVSLLCPSLLPAHSAQLTSGVNSTRLTCATGSVQLRQQSANREELLRP